MSEADLAMARIEAILAEIEQLERDTAGIYRQADDREAGVIVSRIIRKRAQQKAPSE